jgi:hypothetical protein
MARAFAKWTRMQNVGKMARGQIGRSLVLESPMTKIVLQEPMRSQLEKLSAELCDEAGRTLGYFLTVNEYRQLIYEWAKLKYPLEELERRLKAPGERHTTADVLARLRQL